MLRNAHKPPTLSRGLWRAVAAFAITPSLMFAATVQQPIGHLGSVTMTQTNAQEWTKIAIPVILRQPVVIGGPISRSNTHPVTLRLRAVTSEGFEAQIDEYDYLDGSHPQESWAWWALERGVQQLPSGQRAEAIITGASGSAWTSVPFQAGFTSTPVVFAQITSVNDSKAAVVRVRNITQSGCEIILQRQESLATTHPLETVHLIAVTSGSAPTLSVASTGNKVTNKSYALSTTAFGANPLLLAAMQSSNNLDTASVRLVGRTTKNVSINIE